MKFFYRELHIIPAAVAKVKLKLGEFIFEFSAKVRLEFKIGPAFTKVSEFGIWNLKPETWNFDVQLFSLEVSLQIVKSGFKIFS